MPQNERVIVEKQSLGAFLSPHCMAAGANDATEANRLHFI